jgi:hypothetical protein
MIALLFYTVAAFGLCYIVGHARVSLGVREWMATVGTWDEWQCIVPDCTWSLFDDGRKSHSEVRCPEHSSSMPVSVDCPQTKWVHRVRWFHWPLGWFLSLIECPACLGFWLGLAAGLAWPSLDLGPGSYHAPAVALYTCGANFLLGRATGLIPGVSNGS